MLSVTKLERQWEHCLRAEGMPSELRRMTSRGTAKTGDKRGSIVSLAVIREVAAASLGDAPVARHWALFSQAAHDLPDSWGRRKTFLVAFGEVGVVRQACRSTRTRPDDAYLWLKQFAAWRLVNPC